METAELDETIASSRASTTRWLVPRAWLVIAVVVLAGGLSLYGTYRHLSGSIYGVRVGDLVLDGVTIPAAREQIQQHAQRLSARRVTIQFTDGNGRLVYSHIAPLEEIGITSDVNATWKQIVSQSTRWRNLPALLLRKIAPVRPVDVPYVFTVDSTKSERFVRRVRQAVERPAQDARLIISPDGTRREVPERPGLKLPSEPLRPIIRALQEGQVAASIALETVAPRVTSLHLKAIDTVLAEAVTRFSEAQRNRSHNIRQATERINGVVLLPGDTFSYNQTVGPRTLKEGFRKAPVIVHGELVPGDGGGVCQVSTTLYMAALQAGLEIVQRSKHAFPIGYAPAGLDATVVYGVLDLRFRNNTSQPVAIIARAQRGRMVVQVWGSRLAKRQVRIQRVVHSVVGAPVKTVPAPELPQGVQRVVTKGHAGMRVSVYRIIEEPGKPPLREKVSTDTYRPQTRVVMVGQAPPPPDKPAQTPTNEEPLLQP